MNLNRAATEKELFENPFYYIGSNGWLQMLYNTPIVYTPKKSTVFKNIAMRFDE